MSVKKLSECHSRDDLRAFVAKVTPQVTTMGGRKFVMVDDKNQLHTYSLNQILTRVKKISPHDVTIKQTLILRARAANQQLESKSSTVKTLHKVRHHLGTLINQAKDERKQHDKDLINYKPTDATSARAPTIPLTPPDEPSQSSSRAKPTKKDNSESSKSPSDSLPDQPILGGEEDSVKSSDKEPSKKSDDDDKADGSESSDKSNPDQPDAPTILAPTVLPDHVIQLITEPMDTVDSPKEPIGEASPQILENTLPVENTPPSSDIEEAGPAKSFDPAKLRAMIEDFILNSDNTHLPDIIQTIMTECPDDTALFDRTKSDLFKLAMESFLKKPISKEDLFKTFFLLDTARQGSLFYPSLSNMWRILIEKESIYQTRFCNIVNVDFGVTKSIGGLIHGFKSNRGFPHQVLLYAISTGDALLVQAAIDHGGKIVLDMAAKGVVEKEVKEVILATSKKDLQTVTEIILSLHQVRGPTFESKRLMTEQDGRTFMTTSLPILTDRLSLVCFDLMHARLTKALSLTIEAENFELSNDTMDKFKSLYPDLVPQNHPELHNLKAALHDGDIKNFLLDLLVLKKENKTDLVNELILERAEAIYPYGGLSEDRFNEILKMFKLPETTVEQLFSATVEVAFDIENQELLNVLIGIIFEENSPFCSLATIQALVSFVNKSSIPDILTPDQRNFLENFYPLEFALLVPEFDIIKRIIKEIGPSKHYELLKFLVELKESKRETIVTDEIIHLMMRSFIHISSTLLTHFRTQDSEDSTIQSDQFHLEILKIGIFSHNQPIVDLAFSRGAKLETLEVELGKIIDDGSPNLLNNIFNFLLSQPSSLVVDTLLEKILNSKSVLKLELTDDHLERFQEKFPSKVYQFKNRPEALLRFSTMEEIEISGSKVAPLPTGIRQTILKYLDPNTFNFKNLPFSEWLEFFKQIGFSRLDFKIPLLSPPTPEENLTQLLAYDQTKKEAVCNQLDLYLTAIENQSPLRNFTFTRRDKTYFMVMKQMFDNQFICNSALLLSKKLNLPLSENMLTLFSGITPIKQSDLLREVNIAKAWFAEHPVAIVNYFKNHPLNFFLPTLPIPEFIRDYLPKESLELEVVVEPKESEESEAALAAKLEFNKVLNLIHFHPVDMSL